MAITLSHYKNTTIKGCVKLIPTKSAGKDMNKYDYFQIK